MGKYFGTDGFRGEANVVLTVEHAFKVGRFLGWYFGQDHKAKIVIGNVVFSKILRFFFVKKVVRSEELEYNRKGMN